MPTADEPPHPLYAEDSPYRVRLPGAIASELGWPRDADTFKCYGVFRTDGELLCATVSMTTSEGRHPFESALAVRDSATPPPWGTSLAEFPPTANLVMDFRVFEFNAKWTNAKRLQLDLLLGAARLSLLGWSRHSSEPLYAAARGGVLALIAANKVRAIQRRGLIDEPIE